MGRQILFHALKDDCEEMFSFIREHGMVTAVERDTDVNGIIDLTVPCASKSPLMLWKTGLGTRLERDHIERSVRPYFRVPYRAGLEFCPSLKSEWNGCPGLTQGRIYANTDEPNESLLVWYSRIARWIRARWARCPVPLSGYVGPNATQWHLKGGLLLPTFQPPDTAEWRKFFKKQLANPVKDA
jgi:hypothetical protein